MTVARLVPASWASSSWVRTTLLRRELLELEQPTQDAPLRGHVEGVEQELLPADLVREERDEHLVIRDAGAELFDLRVGDRRSPRARAPATVAAAARFRVDERHLAEALPRPADPERHHVAERGHDADGEAAADDEVERVAGIAAVEDDLALPEAAAAGGGHNALDVLAPAGRRTGAIPCASLCRGGDISNVAAVNDAGGPAGADSSHVLPHPVEQGADHEAHRHHRRSRRIVALRSRLSPPRTAAMRALHAAARPAAHARPPRPPAEQPARSASAEAAHRAHREPLTAAATRSLRSGASRGPVARALCRSTRISPRRAVLSTSRRNDEAGLRGADLPSNRPVSSAM